MERKTEIETEREVLKRIVAMLFSFACLAERVSGRSYPIRCLVLWALRHAEAVARDWLAADSADVMQMRPSAGASPALIAVLHRNSRAEALHLAQSFSALAHMLKRELRLEERFARRLMRGNAKRSKTTTPRRILLTDDLIDRFASTMRVVMHRLRGRGFEAARLDTS